MSFRKRFSSLNPVNIVKSSILNCDSTAKNEIHDTNAIDFNETFICHPGSLPVGRQVYFLQEHSDWCENMLSGI